MTSASPQRPPGDALSAPVVGMTLDGYELKDVLREDGAAVVYRAHHLGLRRDAELRVLRPEAVDGDPAARGRFREAAVATAALEHPCIVPVYAFGESPETAWVASRLLGGPSLEDEITAGAVTPRRALLIVEQLADALDAVHRAGIVHRDVRPDGIWPIGRHVLLGLPGVARTDGATQLMHDTLLGDPQTLAPEQLAGEPAVPASDTYSLAAIFVHALTGTPPFGTGTLGAVLARRVAATPPAVALDGGPCDDLNRRLAQAMAPDPAQRPTSTGAAARSLRVGLEQLPPGALDRPAAFSLLRPGEAMVAPARRPAEEDMPMADATRIDRQRSLAAAPQPVARAAGGLGAAVAFAALAAALAVAAYFGGRQTVSVPGAQQVRAGAVAVTADRDWTEGGAAGPFAGTLASQRMLRGADGATAAVGVLRAPGPRADPLGRAGGGGLSPAPIHLGPRAAIRYDGRVGGVPAHVVVLQSDRTTAAVACTMPAPSAVRVRACDTLAATMVLPGRTVPPTADRRVASALATPLLSLHNLLLTRQLPLAAAHPDELRRGYADVQELYKRAISDLSAVAVSGPDHRLVTGIVGRLQTVVRAYDGLQRAPSSTQARQAVTAAVDGLRRSVNELRHAGYRVERG